tara:strand:+ start:234 stop:530 length:297 start_codon:yes stop_codon:yes gene_type:complete
MTKINKVSEVDLDNKDILVTGEQRLEFLKLHNKLRDMVQYIDECRDITVNHLTVLDELTHLLHSSLHFVPQKDKEGDKPAFWQDYVLESDELAWKKAY